MEPAILYFHGKGLAKSLEQDFVLHAAEESGLLPPSDVTGQLDASVVFVDLASFTSLTESMGDVTATEILSRFSQLVRRAVSRCDGRVVKQIGDAFMLVFPDATSALRGASEIQQRAEDEPQFLGTRLGVHCGPVLYREGDYFGATVNVAARITAEASRNQIVMTAAARSTGTPLPDTEFVPLGTFKLKGLSEAVELFELRSGRRPAVERSTDPVCGMQLAPNEVVGRVAVDAGERVFCSLGCLGQFSEHPERYAS
jgi:class 3 adenylate cyclase/YHS domain-containing protein